MTNYDFCDVVLLQVFPYSDLKSGKKRPALVLADTGDRDLLVCRITSESARDVFDLGLLQWQDNGLLLPSTARVAKMASLEKNLVAKKLGRLGSPDRRKLRTILKRLFGF
jgi:mRNA interferase MazF